MHKGKAANGRLAAQYPARFPALALPRSGSQGSAAGRPPSQPGAPELPCAPNKSSGRPAIPPKAKTPIQPSTPAIRPKLTGIIGLPPQSVNRRIRRRNTTGQCYNTPYDLV